MPNFLFELLIEEMPHGVIKNTSEYINTILPELLSEFGLSYNDVQIFCTPRRLSFLISNLPMISQDQYSEQKGPSVKVSYDNNGNPTNVLERFMSSYNISQNDIIEKEIKGQKYLFICKTEKGEQLEVILPNLLSKLISGIKFAQPMRWNHNNQLYEFIRPVRGLTALLDDQVLPVEFFGIRADRVIFGHRQLFPAGVSLGHADDYVKIITQHGCIPSFASRKQCIVERVYELAQSVQGELLLDDELLNTITALTEFPHPILGEFDLSFLALPKEVLISEMKTHQKYIPIIDYQGKLLPYYIITANVPVDDPDIKENVLSGNSRVLRARFSDGQFFFKEDVKKGLNYYYESLKRVSFVDGAGTMSDKVDRMQKITKYLKKKLGLSVSEEDLEQAVKYAKADLSSLMVGEFPELQGVIGSYYAEQQGMSVPVSMAIKEHYYPRVIEGQQCMPTQELSALVGFADRLDNLCALYAVGKTVTGSRDPYALRRQTIAMIHIIIQFKWKNFFLQEVLSDLSELYQPMFIDLSYNQWKQMLDEFITMRLEGLLKISPYEYRLDTINALFAQGVNNILDDIHRIGVLEGIRNEYGEIIRQLVELSKRIHNILKNQDIKLLQQSLLVEEAEKTLYQAYINTEKQLENMEFYGQLLTLLKLEPFITKFFDSVMVKTGDNTEDNRIALLSLISLLFSRYVDFSKLSL